MPPVRLRHLFLPVSKNSDADASRERECLTNSRYGAVAPNWSLMTLSVTTKTTFLSFWLHGVNCGIAIR